MKLFYLVCVVFALITPTFAQDYIEDKIQNCEGCSKARMYELRAWNHRKIFPDSTLILCDLAINELIQEADTNGLAKLYNYKGIAYHYKGDTKMSFEFYYKAYKYGESHGDSLQYGHAMNNLGRHYFSQGVYTKAFDFCNRALAIFKELKDQDGIAYSLKRISEMYLSQGYVSQALEVTKEALMIRLEYFSLGRQAHTHIDLARIYVKLDSVDKAFLHYAYARDKAKMAKDVVGITNTELGLSDLHIMQGDTEKGLEHAINAMKYSRDIDNQDLNNQVSIQYGAALYHSSKLNDAEKQFLQLLENSESTNQLSLQQKAHLYLSNIYAKIGQGMKAYDHRLKYGEISQLLSASEARRAIDSLLFIVELDSRTRENELLKANEEANEALIKIQKKQNILLSVVLVVVVVVSYVFWSTSRKRKLLNSELTEKNERIIEQQEKISVQNEKLKDHNVLLEEANKEKDFLMNVVAHDLKSPINRIKGITQLLKLTEPNEEQQNYLDILMKVSEDNLDFIRDLLDVSAFEGSERKLNFQEFNVNQLLEEIKEDFKNASDSKGITVNLRLVEKELNIITDHEYCTRILTNLFSNAIKFTPVGKAVGLGANFSDNKIQFSVKDSGPGFTDEDKEQLYKKFTKLSAQPTQGESSNGLGLALVKILVYKLDGEIELNTEVGQGSEFIVSFNK